MRDRFKPINREQPFLVPPSFRDWLPPRDLAYFIIDVVEELDLGRDRVAMVKAANNPSGS